MKKKFLSKFNEYLFKISDLIEKFHLNVAIAKIYEITNLLEDNLDKKIKQKKFIRITN